MPALPMPRHLSQMTPAQFAEVYAGLDHAEVKFATLSGICATLKGLVLIEVKKKLPHGEYLPWLTKNLGKSRTTAAQYVAVAKGFTKCKPGGLHFEQLTLALMDGARSMGGEGDRLDMTHPMVSAVAKWTNGKTFYQLREEFSAERGGKQKKTDETPLTPEEQQEVFLAACREDFRAAWERLDTLNLNHHWKAPSIADAEVESAVAAAQQFIDEAQRWLKTPQKKRTRLEMPVEEEEAETAEPASQRSIAPPASAPALSRKASALNSQPS